MKFGTSLLTVFTVMLLSQPLVASGDAPAVTAMGLPRLFVLNEGQWDARIRAASAGPGLTVSFGREGYSLAIGTGLGSGEHAGLIAPYPGMRLVEPSARCAVAGRDASGPQLRYIRGVEGQSVTHMLTQYRTIRFADAWKGIDIDVTGGGRRMLHEIHVAAGADPSTIRLRFDNATKAQLAQVPSAQTQPAPARQAQRNRTPREANAAVLRFEEDAGGVNVSIDGAASLKAFTVTLAYVYYWGGGNIEAEGNCRVDRSGDLHLTGITASADFPLVPPGIPSDGQRSMTFAAVVSGDGRTVRYSTLLGPGVGFLFNSVRTMAIDKHDRTILHLCVNNIAGLLTPDAEFRPSSANGLAMVVLDSIGAIVYATATPDSGLTVFSDLETGSDGAIYAVSTVDRQPGFLTADAYQSTFQGAVDGLIMKFDPDSYRLTYAGLIGGPDADCMSSIAVDGCGSVAVGGHSGGSGYPVVNAAQTRSAGNLDLVFTRFSPDFRRIVYSTYLGGSYQEDALGWGSGPYDRWGNRRLRFDPDGNLYFTAVTQSVDFPMIRPMQAQPNGLSELVLGKFSPSGELLFTSYFGGSHHEYHGSLDVDACGNMIISGLTASRDLPLLPATADSGSGFLSVIDSRSSTLRHSAFLPYQWVYYIWGGASLVLDGTAVYLAHAVWRQAAVPATPGFPDGGGNDSSDVQVLRFDMPELCSRKVFQDKSTENGGLTATLLGTDTLRIDLDRMSHAPPVIGVRCRVRNQSPVLPSDSVILTLRVPEYLQPAPGSPPLRQALAPLGPGDSVDVEWRLLPVIDSIIPLSHLQFSVTYATGGDCPSGDGFDGVVPVLYTDIPDAEFRCQLFLSPAFEVNRDTTRLSNDTMLVTLRISNISAGAGRLRYAILRLLEGSGVTLLAPTDSVVVPPPVPGKSSVEFQWLIGVKSWPFGRPLLLEAVLVDTFGIVVARCTFGDDIRGTFGSICGLQVSDPVRVRADDSSFVPDPIVATLRIYNPSDTLRPYRDLRLDLSRARHLKAAVGESLRRPDFTIDADTSEGFTWLLRVSPPPNQSVTETVRAIYRTNADTTERSCEFVVRILLLGADIDCTVSCVDSLHLDGATARYTEDTLRVRAVVRNTGSIAQTIRDVLLRLTPEGAAEPLDPLLRTLQSLGPGKSDTLFWNLRVPVLLLPRTIRFDVFVTAPSGAALSSCAKNVHIPALVPECTLAAPDSVRYDAATDTYDPAEFEAVARFENRSDSSYANLRAVLDTTLLQRVTFAPGVTAEQQRATLAPGDAWEVRWRLVPRWADRPYDQRLRVRFFFEPVVPPTLCEQMTSIEGAPRIAMLSCATAGHDSVWADSYYEALIPDPVQLQYTLRNDGSTVLPGCTIAIIPPPMLELLAGEDSIRAVPALLPGEAFSAEWRLRIIEERITQAPWTVLWRTECDGMDDIPQCAHAISFVDRSPSGLVVTPWLLRFAAEQGGALPPGEDVQLWTGGGTEPRWNVASSPVWLDAAPITGAGHSVMHTRPNTTALAPGTHAGTLALTALPLSTGGIEVIYDIRTKLGADDASAARGLEIGAMYPNPVPSGTDVLVRLHADAGTAARLELRDLLGRLRATAEAGEGAADGATVRIPTTGIAAGTYILTARAAGRSVSRLLLVLP